MPLKETDRPFQVQEGLVQVREEFHQVHPVRHQQDLEAVVLFRDLQAPPVLLHRGLTQERS